MKKSWFVSYVVDGSEVTEPLTEELIGRLKKDGIKYRKTRKAVRPAVKNHRSYLNASSLAFGLGGRY